MADRSLSARVADFVARHKLLPRGAVVVVGVSGGADSIALLHGLRALGRDHDHPLRLHVAHLHHGIRGADADADAAFVESLAADLGLPCIRDHVDIPKLHAREPGSREELARRERYRFFERAAARCGADHIAVGHHADDQAETVLHRIVRGTGLRGLAGMAPVRTLRGVEGCRLVRPLLCVTRKEILAYLESGGMAYRTDATNADRDLTRNRIRGELLPELARDYNPRVRAALVRLAEQAGGAYAFIDATAIKTLAAVTVRADAGEVVLNAEALARKDRMVQAEVFRRVLGRFDCGEQRLAFSHLDAVITLMANGVDGRAVSLPYGITARLMGSLLVFSVEATTPPGSSGLRGADSPAGYDVRRAVGMRGDLHGPRAARTDRSADSRSPGGSWALGIHGSRLRRTAAGVARTACGRPLSASGCAGVEIARRPARRCQGAGGRARPRSGAL
jgi:tRNA(Ile)-lysidine synthase